MSKKKKTFGILFYIGYMTLLTGAILHITEWKYAPYLFASGVALSIISRFFSLESNNDFRVKRLNNLLALGTVLWVATAYFMFRNSNTWALTLAIATTIDLVVSFRYPATKK